MMTIPIPEPLFDTLAQGIQTNPPHLPPLPFTQTDYEGAADFLVSYNGSQATFNAYRREVERLLHWSWLVAKKSIIDLRRDDIEAFIRFCQKPPLTWIGTKKAPRFILLQGKRIQNSDWRPFVATVSKFAHRKGQKPNVNKFQLSQGAIKEIFAIL